MDIDKGILSNLMGGSILMVFQAYNSLLNKHKDKTKRFKLSVLLQLSDTSPNHDGFRESSLMWPQI